MSSRFRPRATIGARFRNLDARSTARLFVMLACAAMALLFLYAIITTDEQEMIRAHCATAYNPDRCVEMLGGSTPVRSESAP